MPPEPLRAAFEYLERGWIPLPLQPRSKLPLLPWRRLQRERPEAEDLEQWWSLWPEANLGIITGAASRLAVVDLDGPEAQALAEQLDLPDAPTVRTGEGLHVYCSIAGPTRSAVALRPGIDLRADGGYVVAPPSVHPSGRSYVWVVQPRDVLPPLPAWAIQRNMERNMEQEERRARWVVRALRGVEEGHRNATCARLAGHFLSHGIAPDVLRVTLLAWNGLNRPPLSEAEVRQTIAAIVTRGRRQRAEALPEIEGSLVEFHVDCSTGTYVRSLAHELGQKLGCGAHLESLRRLRVGEFSVENAVTMHQLQRMRAEGRAGEAILPMSGLLASFDAIALTGPEVGEITHGKDLLRKLDLRAGARYVKLLDPSGSLTAIGEIVSRHSTIITIHPSVVLAR